MSYAQYQIYRRDVFRLAKTMVIKSDLAAQITNYWLQSLGHVINDQDPRTWKYYKNLAGEYHETDELMTIRSIDTLENIAFTKENLAFHRATREEYQHGTRYYNDLLSQYPNQETLILGILNPIDIDEAIAAEDGAILWYDRQYIEPQERQLIPELEQWIQRFLSRWQVKGYAWTEELYVLGQLAVLYANLPKTILNLREAACGTIQAHSYHIREYLASYHGLDRYLDGLNLHQILFLYRNVRYLSRYAGHQSTFQALVENLASPRNIPIATYDVVHRTVDLDQQIYPTIEAHRSFYNDPRLASVGDQTTVEALQEEILGFGQSNQREYVAHGEKVQEQFRDSVYSTTPTKVLESSILDTSNARFYQLRDFAVNHWIYYSYLGQYLRRVPVTDPLSGETTQLLPFEAFLAYLYALNASWGIRLTYIPDVRSGMVLRDQPPTLEELESKVDTNLVTRETLWSFLNTIPDLEDVPFEERVDRITKIANFQYRYVAWQENALIRAMVEAIHMSFFTDTDCSMYTEDPNDPALRQTYSDWLAARNLRFESLDSTDLGLIADGIYEDATGLSRTGSKSLRELQGNVIGIFQELSSYSVEFLTKINDEQMWYASPLQSRWAVESSIQYTRRFYDIRRIDILKQDTRGYIHRDEEVAPTAFSNYQAARTGTRYESGKGINYSIINQPLADLRIPISRPFVTRGELTLHDPASDPEYPSGHFSSDGHWIPIEPWEQYSWSPEGKDVTEDSSQPSEPDPEPEPEPEPMFVDTQWYDAGEWDDDWTWDDGTVTVISSGYWNDDGVWVDTSNWNDGT